MCGKVVGAKSAEKRGGNKAFVHESENGESQQKERGRGREEIARIKCVCVYPRLRVSPPREMRRWYGAEVASESEVQ